MKRFFKDVKRNKMLLLMTLPAVVYMIMFNYIPMFGVVLAFKQFNPRQGILGSKWVGLKNFEFIFKSGNLSLLLRNTLGYAILFLILGTVLRLLLAILFDSLGKSKIIKFNQTLSILPHFLSFVVIGYFVNSFLSADKGIFNQILNYLGKDGIDWYNEKRYWPYILTFVNMWQTIGWGSIIYFSTIRGFSSDYYEAASIDGAGWWSRTRYITLPLLRPTVSVLLIMSIGSLFNSGLDLFYIIPRNSGALYSVTSTIDTYVYNALLTGTNTGMSAAVALFQSVCGFVLVILSNWIIKKLDPDSAMF